MNIETPIMSDLDPDLETRLVSRQDLFRSARARLGALATAPVVLAAVSTQAFGQGAPGAVAEILNFALTLEYLEDEFYRTALAQPRLIPGRYRAVFETISRHESEHVALLIQALAGGAIPKPRFDFTARGKYPGVFRNFSTFAAVSNALEDTGVAAYKGQAPRLTGAGALLTTALQIHSVEARHAAEVRRIRGVRPWNGPLDYPLTMQQVLAKAGPFIVG